FVAWRLGESSQQPTCPQTRHRRRWTHLAPMARHSSQPVGVFGSLACRSSKCLHSLSAMSLRLVSLPGDAVPSSLLTMAIDVVAAPFGLLLRALCPLIR